MVEIKIINGVPCIVVPEGVFEFKFKQEYESKDLNKHKNFTEIQNLKDMAFLNEILAELKKKFKNIR
ncbi:MAG: hypothetical protein ACTSPD_05400 [Promethearchaeota archaeon]